jgi:hypothetical protein
MITIVSGTPVEPPQQKKKKKNAPEVFPSFFLRLVLNFMSTRPSLDSLPADIYRLLLTSPSTQKQNQYIKEFSDLFNLRYEPFSVSRIGTLRQPFLGW